MQKAYRNLLRPEFAELNLSPEKPLPAAGDIQGMAEALAEFTTKKGAEITDWAGANVHRKLDVIYAKNPGINLAMSVALTSIYRDASEILHGTFYASEMFWEPRFDENGIPRTFDDKYVYDHLITLFTAIFHSINGMLETVAERYEVLETRGEVLKLLKEAASLLSEGGKASPNR